MKSTLTIGRSSHCDIIIPNESISREHGRISVVGGRYVYEDVGRNGSVIGGRLIHGERIAVSPGAEILLAGKVPLPWAQIYTMLPLTGVSPYSGETRVDAAPIAAPAVPVQTSSENIGIGYAILAFLFPIAGWIMYFVWRSTSPTKASQASTIAWVGFALNVLFSFVI